MIFSELYSAYYNTVAAVLSEAVKHPVKDRELRAIIEKHAFDESIVTIPDALKEERWPLLKEDGTTPISNAPSMPLTTLEKRWLKALSLDPRIRLFGETYAAAIDAEPLFRPEDVIIFDQYLDGDDYEDAAYIANFRLILDAIRNNYPLQIESLSGKGNKVCHIVLPEYLEYSEKDDKFRLVGAGEQFSLTINLGRITSCEPYTGSFDVGQEKRIQKQKQSVAFELVDERKALERVLLHFAHFEKSAERISEDRYSVTVCYDKEDETEMVIRILSFGPMIRITSPQHFINQIKERLTEQKSCGMCGARQMK